MKDRYTWNDFKKEYPALAEKWSKLSSDRKWDIGLDLVIKKNEDFLRGLAKGR